MKARILRTTIVCLTLTGFFALNAQAGPKVPANVASLLTEAYADLDHADHDYKGHRIDAMKQIDAAGKLLKLNLRGDGKGHEKQGVSDDQVVAAQSVLTQIQSELATGKHPRLLKHVNKALEELSIALKIK